VFFEFTIYVLRYGVVLLLLVGYLRNQKKTDKIAAAVDHSSLQGIDKVVVQANRNKFCAKFIVNKFGW
jgi:hypothetical protein